MTRPRRSTLVQEVRALLGPAPPGRPGTLHVAAVFRDEPDGIFSVLRVNADTPASPTDAFSLGLARARADAILTSGRNLRAEPTARHTLTHAVPDAGSRGEAGAAALRAWRRDVLGLATPARSVVLTRDPALDLSHPMFRAAHRPLVLTSPEVASVLAERAHSTHAPPVEIVGRADTDLRWWIAYLRFELGLATLLVEAGPSTARGLYAPPPLVDELVLSICPASAVRAGARGPAFLHEEALASAGLRCVHALERAEPSGIWWFRRYLRSEVKIG